jgi:hypothetical protein
MKCINVKIKTEILGAKGNVNESTESTSIE